MTDLEKIELSIRRVAADASGPIRYWLIRLADQIVKDETARVDPDEVEPCPPPSS